MCGEVGRVEHLWGSGWGGRKRAPVERSLTLAPVVDTERNDSDESFISNAAPSCG